MAERAHSSWSEAERHARLDALYLWWPYSEGSLRRSIEALIEEAKAGAWGAEREQEFLRYAEATWPARIAVKRFAREQEELVWQEVIKRCLSTTHVLLERLAEREGHTRFFTILRSPAADFALFESERRELELLLPQIYTVLWADHARAIKPFLEEAERALEQARARYTKQSSPSERAAFEQALVFGEEMA